MTIENWATTTGSWNIAANWSPVGVPGTADNAVFATGDAAPESVVANTQSFDVVDVFAITHDTVTLAGEVAAQSLAIGGGGTLDLGSNTIGTVLYAGTVAIGPTGGSLDMFGYSYLEDITAVIDGSAGQTAAMMSSGSWMNQEGITVTGADAFLELFGSVSTGPEGLLVTAGATLFDFFSTLQGAVTLDAGTLQGYGPSLLLTVDGTDNVIVDNPLVRQVTLTSVSDGTMSGGFTTDVDLLALENLGRFSGGVTLGDGTLDLVAAGAAGTGTIAFATGSAATLRIERGATPTNTIAGFGTDDTIDLPSIAFAAGQSLSDAGDTFTLSGNGTVEALLTLVGIPPGLMLAVSDDGSGGTAITLPKTFEATGSSGSWTTPGLWSPAGVPMAGEYALLSAPGNDTISVDGTQAAAGVVLDAAGAALVVDPGAKLVTSLVTVDAGTLVDEGILEARTLTLNGGTVEIGAAAGFISSSGPTFPLVVANGGTIDIVGSAAGSASTTFELSASGGAPVSLAGGSLTAVLVQPGTFITSAQITFYGSASTDVIDGGVLSDNSSSSIVFFAPAVSAELILPYGNSPLFGAPIGSNNRSYAATVVAGTGADTVAAYGGSSTIFGGAGPLTFVGFPASNFLDADSLILPSVPYSAEIIGGTASVQAYGASGNAGFGVARDGTNLFFGGSGGGNVLVSGGGASTLVGGGSGDQLYANGTVAALLVAGSGNETLSGVGSSGGNLIYGGTGSELIIAGAGYDTILAGTGTQTIFGGSFSPTAILAGSGRNLIVAGASPDYIRAGSGSSTIFAGAADIVGVVDGAAGGTLYVGGFSVGSDLLQLQGYGTNASANALANAAVAQGNTVLTLSDATRIVLYGVTNLTVASFI